MKKSSKARDNYRSMLSDIKLILSYKNSYRSIKFDPKFSSTPDDIIENAIANLCKAVDLYTTLQDQSKKQHR